MKQIVKVTTATVLAATFVATSVFSAPVLAESNETIEQIETQQLIPVQNNMDLSVQAALFGPEIKKVDVFGHEFNVKPAYISKEDHVTIVNGQISHHLSWRPDDQLYYRIEKENGEVKKIEIEIDRGGWSSISTPFLLILAEYAGVTITPDLLEKIGRQMGEFIDGKWEYAAEAIISNIALQVD